MTDLSRLKQILAAFDPFPTFRDAALPFVDPRGEIRSTGEPHFQLNRIDPTQVRQALDELLSGGEQLADVGIAITSDERQVTYTNRDGDRVSVMRDLSGLRIGHASDIGMAERVLVSSGVGYATGSFTTSHTGSLWDHIKFVRPLSSEGVFYQEEYMGVIVLLHAALNMAQHAGWLIEGHEFDSNKLEKDFYLPTEVREYDQKLRGTLEPLGSLKLKNDDDRLTMVISTARLSQLPQTFVQNWWDALSNRIRAYARSGSAAFVNELPDLYRIYENPMMRLMARNSQLTVDVGSLKAESIHKHELEIHPLTGRKRVVASRMTMGRAHPLRQASLVFTRA